MANKTTWNVGQSGNPKGRPPKSRALTEILAAAGNEKCSDGDGGEIPKKKLIARMLWQAATSMQVKAHGTNRDWGDDKVWDIKPGDWFEIVKWLFAQIDGELSVSIKEESSDESQTPGALPESPVHLYLPDNGRAQKPTSEDAEKQAT